MNAFETRSTNTLAMPDASTAGFDVRDLVCCAVESATFEAKTKQLLLKRSVQSLLPSRLHGDSASLCRLLCEFVTRAVQHAQRGEICLSAELEDESAAEVTVRFSLSDSSTSLPRQLLTESFVAGDLIESVGGQILVETNPGRGSSLSLLVSLLKSSAGTAERIVLH